MDNDFDYPPKKKKKLNDLQKQKVNVQINELKEKIEIEQKNIIKHIHNSKEDKIKYINNIKYMFNDLNNHYKNLYQCTDLGDENYKNAIMNNFKIIKIIEALHGQKNNAHNKQNLKVTIENKNVQNLDNMVENDDLFLQQNDINKYIIIKAPLIKVLNKSIKKVMNNNLYIINDASHRVNKIVIHTYQFLRLFIIKDNQRIDGEFIKITHDVVSMCMKVFMKETNRGRHVLGENKKMLDYFLKLYDSDYRPLYDGIKIDGSRLSGILNYIETEIITAIENNVKMHFIEYLNRFVNCSFREKHDGLLEKLMGSEKEELKNKLANELKVLKSDFINMTSERDPKYNEWFEEYRYKVVPFISTSYTKDHLCYIKSHPQEYIACMKRMSGLIIEMGYNSFQFFPLRTNVTPKYIPLDTKSLTELLMNDDTPKNDYYGDKEKYKNKIWYSIFNMNDKTFKKNPKCNSKYEFDYRILTDGKTVSIQFIHESFIDDNNLKKSNLKTGRSKARTQYKNLKRDEIDELKKERQNKKDNYNEKQAEKSHEQKEKFKELNANEKEEVIKKIKEKKIIEFPYLEELTDEQIEKLKELQLLGKLLYVDPGKKNIIYIVNDNGAYFRYSNAERIFETKRLEYQTKIQKYKDTNGISKMEHELIGLSSKSCNLEDYKQYVMKKNEINIKLIEDYRADIFRKYKWYSFINKKRSEDNLINKIEKVYGKGCVMIYGDWSMGKQMRGLISTPGKSIKRKLATRFPILSIDEHKTSKVNYKTFEETKNMYIPDRTGTLRKKHSILMFKTENGRMGYMNRDKSAVNGMKTITSYFLEHKERHPAYKREIKKKIKKAIDLEAQEEPNKKTLKKIPKKKGIKNQKKENLLVSNVSKSPKEGTFKCRARESA